MEDSGSPDDVRRGFFRSALGHVNGWFCVTTFTRSAAKRMEEHWYQMPDQFDYMVDDVNQNIVHGEHDVYFCPHTFKSQSRTANNVLCCPTVWADLDECRPDTMDPRPSLAWETSPGRYQALWSLDDLTLDPSEVEDICKRIAYAYADEGCDRSGWDLSQLLRVPLTKNYKYIDTDVGPVDIALLGARPSWFRIDEFAHFPAVALKSNSALPYPEDIPSEPGRAIMESFMTRLPAVAFEIHDNVPTGDWSKTLFRLEMYCFEAGMTRAQVLKVALDSRCNKFARDGLGSDYVWTDVCRASTQYDRNVHQHDVVSPIEDKLLTDEEYEQVANIRTFVEDYIDWASGLGDAATQYHQGGAFIILSSLLAGNVSLPTAFGRIVPNLWFMILADTTLTRKSTAMDIATDLLIEVDADIVMATDGSIEGLMQGLSTRPGKPSMFLRDEFSGLLEQITKKDYYAGMAETLTKLYDGKLQKRILRKETIEVRDPVLIVFAGGIRTRVQQLLKFDHISSGFIPRFLFLTAESDASRVQPMGPPTDLDTSGREALLDQMTELYNFYHAPIMQVLGNGVQIPGQRKCDAVLTQEAWDRYNSFERQMLDAGLKTEHPELMTPLFDRLAKSSLRIAVLLAASRKLQDTVEVGIDDILLAIKYAIGFREYAIDVVNGVGKSAAESQLETVMDKIKTTPGISRSRLMRNYHLSAREADAIFSTLEQRGLVSINKQGRGSFYHAV
jgi:hypothetical protein